MTIHMRRPLGTAALAVALVIAVTACASDEPQAVTNTSVATTSTAPTSTTLPGRTTTTAPATTTVPETTTTLDTPDVVIAGGAVTAPDRFSVTLGEMVSIVVVSDVDDEIHVHGYDLYFDVVAGVPNTIEFVASTPGVFEVEVHTGHTHIFDIEVVG